MLKDFKLSNPVGRRAYRPPANFSIPKEKKEVLRAHVQSLLEPAARETAPTESAPHSEPAPEPQPQDVPEIFEPDTALPLPPDLMEAGDLFPAVEGPAGGGLECAFPGSGMEEFLVEDQGPVLGRMGAALLWFSLLNTCGRGSWLHERVCHAVGQDPGNVTGTTALAALAAPFFDLPLGDCPGGQVATLCRLAGLEDHACARLLEMARSCREPRVVDGLAREISIGSTLAARVLVRREDKHLYFRLPGMTLIDDPAAPDPGAGGIPLMLAVDQVVDELLTNIRPPVVDMSRGGTMAQAAALFQAMEIGAADNRLSVDILGEDGRSLASFPDIPRLARGLIIRFSPEDPGLADVEYEWIGNKLFLNNIIYKKRWSCHEGILTLDRLFPLRVVPLEQEGRREVLLSNMMSRQVSLEELVRVFFMSAAAPVPDASGLPVSVDAGAEPAFSSLVSDPLGAIIDRMTSRMLGLDGWPRDRRREIYALPGRCYRQGSLLMVHLLLPPEHKENLRLAPVLARANAVRLMDAETPVRFIMDF